MKTIETKVYSYDELSDEAKQKAREWFLEGGDEGQFAYEHIVDDAKEAGLEIDSIDDHKPNSGSFIKDALSCAKTIIENHGEDCETHKTAKQYLHDRTKIVMDTEEEDNSLGDDLEELDREFLASLLEDYRIMFNKELEYQTSDEVVADNITANEYTFLESGKRFG